MPDEDDKTKEAAVDDFLDKARQFSPESQRKYDELKGRRGKELDLWHKWDQSGRKPGGVTPILKSLEPVIKRQATVEMQGLGGSIPRATVENELLNHTLKAIQTFNPNLGVSLTTHARNKMRAFSDTRNAYRNEKRMPSADVKRWDAWRNVTGELQSELGRQPTPHEIRERAPEWSAKTIERMQRGFGRELYTDMGDGLGISDEHPQISFREAFMQQRPRLNPEQQRFGQLFFPPPGEAQPNIKNVAKALGVSEDRAYKIKSQVEDVIGPMVRKQ